MDPLRDFCKSSVVGRTRNLGRLRKQWHEVFLHIQIPCFLLIGEGGDQEYYFFITCSLRTIDYLKLEGTHKDHEVQQPAPRRTAWN